MAPQAHINRERDGVSVEAVTVAGNKADALRLLGWLKSEKNIAPSLGGVFGSERLGWAVQAFMDPTCVPAAVPTPRALATSSRLPP